VHEVYINRRYLRDRVCDWNHKFLVQTRDLWSILRKQFRNIYVYEVNGGTVQQTVRLVYPHMLTFAGSAQQRRERDSANENKGCICGHPSSHKMIHLCIK
jgi:hypothetical protein